MRFHVVLAQLAIFSVDALSIVSRAAVCLAASFASHANWSFDGLTFLSDMMKSKSTRQHGCLDQQRFSSVVRAFGWILVTLLSSGKIDSSGQI
jgi:hypothetical protein